MTEYWIFYRGLNRIREHEIWRRYGLEFEKGKVYRVSPEVYEYLKGQKGFERCWGIGSKEMMDFPKRKNEAEKPAKTEGDAGKNVAMSKVRSSKVK